MIIGHLFPELMGLYGEYANVSALVRRLTDAGEPVKVQRILVGEDLDLSGCDFLYIGGGTDSALQFTLRELKRNPGIIDSYSNFGGRVLATGNACALFGRSITIYGETEGALGIADFDVTLSRMRKYAEYIMSTVLSPIPVVGAINTSLEFTAASHPLFQVMKTSDKKKDMQVEGYLGENIYATSLIGPLLIRNPHLLTFFAETISGKKLETIQEPWGRYAEHGHSCVLATLQKEISGKG